MKPDLYSEGEGSAPRPAGEDDAWRMSFAEVAVQLSITQPGSERAQTMEREIRRRLAREARVLLPYQIAVAMLAGAVLALGSYYMGTLQRAVPAHEHPGQSSQAHGTQSTPPDLRRE
jgi:hypothetical protein